MTISSFFDNVPAGPPDPMFDLQIRLNNDRYPGKIDLGAGVYRDERGAYFELPAIKLAKHILDAQDLGHEYDLTTGNQQFLGGAQALVFGADSEAIASHRIASVQTIAGTGANHLGAVFARKFLAKGTTKPTVYIGTPAWGNYVPLFKQAGFQTVEYKYYDLESKIVDFASIIDVMKRAEAGSVFVLQACCHNPTGMDFSRPQWVELATAFENFGHVPFLDIAYQGFGNGFDEDAFGVRHFVERGFELIVCQSFSKNMGLYGERVGALHVVVGSQPAALNVADQLRCLIRWEFSSSPAYGARLASLLMSCEELNKQWQDDVSAMRARLETNRILLYKCLTETLNTPGKWDHILQEKGLFSYLTLSPSQIKRLTAEFHIHMSLTGRINVAGLNPRSMEIVSKAIDTVIRDDAHQVDELSNMRIETLKSAL